MTEMRRIFVFIVFVVIGLTMIWAGNDDDNRKYDRYFLEAMMQRHKGNADATFDLLKRCVEIDSTQAAAYFYLSQCYNALRNKEKALECLEKATRIDEGNATYHEMLAGTYLASNKLEEGKVELEALRRISPSRDNVDQILVELYKQTADYGSAIRLLDEMERADGKNERISEKKSEIYTSQGNRKAAIKEMKELTEQYPNDLNLKVKYAVTLMNNGQEKKGVELIKAVMNEEPNNAMAQFAMLDYAIVNDNDELAENIGKQLLVNTNTDPQTRIYLLQTMVKQFESGGKDSTAVLALFDEVLASPNADEDAAMMKAAYMEAKKMPEDSISNALERVLQIAPDNVTARLRLVQNAWKADDKDKVIELCSQARLYTPEEMIFYYFQGIAYYQKEEDDKALDAFDNGTKVINDESNPDIVSDFYAMMGDILHKKGMEQEAYAAYDSCLQWKDDNLSALNNYAYFLSQSNTQLDKAEQMSYKTIKAEPENSTYLDTYAWILFMQGRYSEAKIYIDQALQHLETKEGNSVYYEHAGDIYYHTGNVDEAVEKWREALQIDPDNDVLKRKVEQRKIE